MILLLYDIWSKNVVRYLDWIIWRFNLSYIINLLQITGPLSIRLCNNDISIYFICDLILALYTVNVCANYIFSSSIVKLLVYFCNTQCSFNIFNLFLLWHWWLIICWSYFSYLKFRKTGKIPMGASNSRESSLLQKYSEGGENARFKYAVSSVQDRRKNKKDDVSILLVLCKIIVRLALHR